MEWILRIFHCGFSIVASLAHPEGGKCKLNIVMDLMRENGLDSPLFLHCGFSIVASSGHL